MRMGNINDELETSYPEAVDGDIYWNPVFCDLWIVNSRKFIKINDGYSIDLDEPEGFVKVGHIDIAIRKK